MEAALPVFDRQFWTQTSGRAAFSRGGEGKESIHWGNQGGAIKDSLRDLSSVPPAPPNRQVPPALLERQRPLTLFPPNPGHTSCPPVPESAPQGFLGSYENAVLWEAGVPKEAGVILSP